MKTGRKLTERQKAERAAGREATRQAEELGPLFADQAVRPDVDALLMERRLGAARERDHSVVGQKGGLDVLDRLHERHLMEMLGRFVSVEMLARLVEYRRRVYPDCPTYGVQFWKDCLAGRKVVLSVVRAGTRYTKYGEFPFVVEAEAFPPEDWVPPFAGEELKHRFWSRCENCRRWHSPGQTACYESGDRTGPPKLPTRGEG